MEQHTFYLQSREFSVNKTVYDNAEENLDSIITLIKAGCSELVPAMAIIYMYTYKKLESFHCEPIKEFKINNDVTKFFDYEFVKKLIDIHIKPDNDALTITTLIMFFDYASDCLDSYYQRNQDNSTNVKNEPADSDISPFALLIIEIIGTTGFFEYESIYPAFEKLYNARRLSDLDVYSKYKYAIRNLKELALIKVDSTVRHPLKRRYAVYTLTDKGEEKFKSEFNKAPVVSESVALTKDHDNLEHALGIRAVLSLMLESGEYSFVSMDRSDNTIRLDNGRTYIPDIVVKGQVPGKPYPFTAYFEYERGTHHQDDFNDKMDKAEMVNRRVHIICPGNKEVRIIENKVERYIRARGADNLKEKRLRSIRITTLDYIQKAIEKKTSLNKDSNWATVYDAKNSFKPVYHENKRTYLKKYATQGG